MPVYEGIELVDDLSDELISINEINTESDYSNRPDYQLLQTNKLLLEFNLKNLKSKMIPKLYANYNLGWISGTQNFNSLTNIQNNWFRFSNLGLNLSIPIFKGFYNLNGIEKNKIQINQSQIGIEQFENNTNRELIEAKIKLDNAKRDIEAQKENVSLAQEVYDKTKIKYQEGVGTNLEVVQANTDLKQSQTNYLNALYEGITSQIELKKALGILKQ